ncbi:hypothetical protein R3P38DRAFT_3628712 [Favolaschia claudopus]|uniref:Uncharacterized protein n=1 Tax=Favolaschia claudopus TaxID=2862362 RepID=A0AAV9ZZG0_9AGAR
MTFASNSTRQTPPSTWAALSSRIPRPTTARTTTHPTLVTRNSASAGGDLGLFEEEAAVVPEYDPSEYDPPQSSSLLMFNDTDYSFSSVPVNVERSASYDYSSPSSTGSGEQRSRASSISQSGSPAMNVTELGHRPPPPRPPAVPAPQVPSPLDDRADHQRCLKVTAWVHELHIVPATPTSLETLREPPQEQPLHFPRPRSSSDHDPPSWDNANFIGQMGNIGSAIDDEAPRPRPSFNSFNFGDNGFLSPTSAARAPPPSTPAPDTPGRRAPRTCGSLLPVDFSGPQFLSPVDPPPSIRAHGKHYRSHSSGSARSWSNASSTRPLAVPLPARLALRPPVISVPERRKKEEGERR